METNPRHIGLLQQVYSFCDKYHLSKTLPDINHILKNGLRLMALDNRMNSMTEPEMNDRLICVSIYYNDEFMSTGPFTPDQLKDISELGPDIKFKS